MLAEEICEVLDGNMKLPENLKDRFIHCVYLRTENGIDIMPGKAADEFMKKTGNIVSVSWGDHLIFGEGDGRLNSTAAIRRRMQKWQSELGADTIHWRITRSKINGHYYQVLDGFP